MAYVVPISTNYYYQKSKVYKTNYGQYFTKDVFGNLYLTSIGGYSHIPEFTMFKDINTHIDIFSNDIEL